MIKMKFEGVISPLITPFSEKGEVLERGLRDLIGFQVEKGIKGLFICGTYGSGPLMTLEQRKRVAEIAVDQAGGKATIIVHVGASSVDNVLKLARHAEEIGSNAVASVPPFYYTYDDEALLSFYKQLLSAVDIPVFVYNNPTRSGMAISSELLRKLAEEGIAGIKDSSFNLVKFYEDLITVCKKDFIFLIGTEALMLPAIIAGAKGCVSGMANVFPEKVVECYSLIKEKRYEEAIVKQMEIIKARRILHLFPTIPTCYEILKARGVNAGYPKAPFRRLKPSEIEIIINELKANSFVSI